MALPQTEAEMRRAAEAIQSNTVLYRPAPFPLRNDPPKLRAWPVRLWCALRGHAGITFLPGTVYYLREGLCKRCGARVSL